MGSKRNEKQGGERSQENQRVKERKKKSDVRSGTKGQGKRRERGNRKEKDRSEHIQ